MIRCQGDGNEPRCFSTWAAIALAGIGKLPATLAHRSIEIKLRRKTTSEPAQRLDLTTPSASPKDLAFRLIGSEKVLDGAALTSRVIAVSNSTNNNV